mmetsp:Transcript_2923/g.4199  ORF Transcript_2923/g.4199 Transcript_2923/m.4199 type:complete len:162 (+) Transcript_2923:80-565(+)
MVQSGKRARMVSFRSNAYPWQHKKMEQVCIVGYSRTPIGSFGGTLSSVKATELGSITIKESLKRSGIQPDQVEHVFMGNVVSAGTGQHPARQAALGAGIPVDCPCTTLNKMCASGMKAVSLGYMSVATGDAQVVVAGGFESMSNIPFCKCFLYAGFPINNN